MPRTGSRGRRNDDLVFTTEVGTPVDAGNFPRRIHCPLLERAGLPNTYGHVTDRMHKDATTAMEAALSS